jgi:ferredoxin
LTCRMMADISAYQLPHTGLSCVTCRVTFKDGYSMNISRFIDFEMESVFK